MTFEIRNLPTPPEGLGRRRAPELRRQYLLRRHGFLVVDNAGFQVFKSTAASSAATRRQRRRGQRRSTKKRWTRRRRKRRPGRRRRTWRISSTASARATIESLHADVAIGARSAAFCPPREHQLSRGRTLKIAQSTGRAIGDEQANGDDDPRLPRTLRCPAANR